MATQRDFGLKIESLPRAPKFDIHIWVDYIELLCLVNQSQSIYKADIVDRIREREDLGESLTEREDEIDAIYQDMAAGLQESNSYEELGDPAAEIDDQWSQRVYDWFIHLGYRQNAFDDFYPFIVDDQHSELKLVPELTLKHHLYLFLLLAANSRYLRNSRNIFYEDFETVSLEALKKCLPAHAEIHIFGTSSRGTGRYQEPHLYNRIQKLASDLREQVLIPSDKFSPHDVGDKGLDLVGWVPMGDKVNRSIVVFGQCACSAEEWEKKQHSSSDQYWRGTISLSVPPSNMTFVPFCLRDAKGEWHRPQNIAFILVDRLRFIKLLNNEYSFMATQRSYQLIQNILQVKEANI